MTDREQRLQELHDGMLGKQFYVIRTWAVKPPDEVRAMLLEHLEHQVKLEKDGILFAAGPVVEEDGKPPAYGMIVIRANSFADADAIAASDPFHKAGLREYSVARWTVNEGSLTVRINYSDQSMSIE